MSRRKTTKQASPQWEVVSVRDTQPIFGCPKQTAQMVARAGLMFQTKPELRKTAAASAGICLTVREIAGVVREIATFVEAASDFGLNTSIEVLKLLED